VTESRYPRADFERDVGRILEYIRAGDTFQTVLPRRQIARGAVDPLRLYRCLRALNPAPYLFHLAFDDFSRWAVRPKCWSASEDGEGDGRPIAGTRPRGVTPAEDEALGRDLAADEKERAEHLMLVTWAATTWAGWPSSAACGSPTSSRSSATPTSSIW